MVKVDLHLQKLPAGHCRCARLGNLPKHTTHLSRRDSMAQKPQFSVMFTGCCLYCRTLKHRKAAKSGPVTRPTQAIPEIHCHASLAHVLTVSQKKVRHAPVGKKNFRAAVVPGGFLVCSYARFCFHWCMPGFFCNITSSEQPKAKARFCRLLTRQDFCIEARGCS